MRRSPAHRPNAFKSAAQGMVSALEGPRRRRTGPDFHLSDRVPGYQTAGYLRVFGEGQFHTAEYLFGGAAPGWAERYQTKQYSIDDPVVIATCRSTGAFTLNEVADPSRAGAPILADYRMHGLFDGVCAPIRAGYDEVGVVLLGADHLLEPSDYERFLLHGMCGAYARAGLALLPCGLIRRR